MTPTSFGRLEQGHHTQTKKLQGIADAFAVPIEMVLVTHADDDHLSLATEARERLVTDVAARVLAMGREGMAGEIVPGSFEQSKQLAVRAVEAEAKQRTTRKGKRAHAGRQVGRKK